MLRAILNKSWRQHPTRHQLYGHLPPITKTIQVRQTRHAGHCWRSRDELIRDVLLWTPTHCRAKARRPARTYIQQLCEDTGCCPEDLPRVMNDTSATWWWYIYMSMVACYLYMSALFDTSNVQKLKLYLLKQKWSMSVVFRVTFLTFKMFISLIEAPPKFLYVIVWSCILVFVKSFMPSYLILEIDFQFRKQEKMALILIGLMSSVFANGLEDLGSILGQVIPKTQKMALDTTLLNTQHFKVSIKGKVEQSRERSSALSYTFV